jgi:hypothetical protein
VLADRHKAADVHNRGWFAWSQPIGWGLSPSSALLFDVYEISNANDEAKLDILDELKARDECSFLVVVLGVTNP